MNIPKDPIMLLSVINTALRDKYDSLEELCKTECVDINYIEAELKKADYTYVKELNKFM